MKRQRKILVGESESKQQPILKNNLGECNYTALAIMFKKIKDNNGNSIWNSDSEGNGREERIRNAVNRITAPYKNGWSYLDYNGNGYTGKIASGKL